MKYLEIYKTMGCSSKEKVFEYLVGSLKESNTRWDYFIDWRKVFDKIGELRSGLDTLNTLIGKEDFDGEFKSLLRRYPYMQTVIPSLIASRERRFDILTDYTGSKLEYETFFFQPSHFISDEEIEKALKFVKETGIDKLFTDKKIDSVTDYIFGIEVGLNSSGRKNRGGHIMEDIVEVFIKNLCRDNGFEYIKEGTSDKIQSAFGIDVPVDKSSRRYDFVIFDHKKVYIVETNFYGGGGSKLKSTAGEYTMLYSHLKNAGHTLIWVTDGIGWKNNTKPLEEAFNHIDYLLNLAMLEKGVLAEIVRNSV